MAGGAGPRALVALVRRNRRRYGGYLVHVGMAVLFVGRRGVVGLPGQARRAARRARRAGRRLRGHLRQPTAATRWRRTGGSSGSTSARGCACRDGKRRRDAATERSYFPSAGGRPRPARALLRGRGDERGRPAGRRAARRLDGGAPDLRKLEPIMKEGDKVFAAARETSTRASALLLARRCAASTRSYADAAARDVPPDRLADGHLDLDRRADRLPRRPDRALAVAARRARGPPPTGASGPRGARLRLIDFLVILVVLALVVLLVSGPLRARRARGGDRGRRARRARGRARRQVPRDPRRRARPPDRQALRGRLARARPRAARRGRRHPTAPRRVSTLQPPARSSVPRCMRRTLILCAGALLIAATRERARGSTRRSPRPT